MNNTFELIEEGFFSEIGGTAKLFKHKKTGAQVLSVCNKDINKSFGISFATPPKNSTGVAHILEHSVLCGSEKYPTKEPFVELLKGSLQTFLNAMTYPDKTCYPVASTNTQDFYNLIDVYIDAVFFPRVRTKEGKDILAQEGWHIDTLSGKWEFKGVVYNEMKGVYSSPDSVLAEESQHAVFPDILYSLDSGGKPEEILKLTYEEFSHFHETYYHPSNAFIFFYGDDAENTRLEKMDTVLSCFEKKDIPIAIPFQNTLPKPRKIEVAFEGEEEKGHTTVNWLLCPTYEPEKSLALAMLDHILTALPGSPLRLALISSGLGEDIHCHLEEDLQQMYYSIGLRSLELGKEDEMEALILSCLGDLVENGIDKKAIEAAVNATEFALRENNSGRFPRGLALMSHCLTYWIYGKSPITALQWEKPLAAIKEKLAKKERLFEELIETYFINNTHRILVNLLPSSTLGETKAKAEEEAIQKIYQSLNEVERKKIEAESQKLHELQGKEDSPEALASIPMLTLDDLPKQNMLLPLEKKEEDIEIFVHDIDSTGIIYAKLLLSLDYVPAKLLPLLSLYTRALTELGTKHYDFVELGLEIETSTGGLFANSLFMPVLGKKETLNTFIISGKATEEKIGKLTHLIEEVLFYPDFNKKDRFMQMVLEEKARLEQALIPAGHSFVSLRLGAMQSSSGALNEYTQGIEYLQFIRELSAKVESQWQSIVEDLNALHKAIITKNKGLLDITANGHLIPKALIEFKKITTRLPLNNEKSQVSSWPQIKALTEEALIVPAQVNYVGLGTNLHEHGYAFNGTNLVVSRYLRMGYLWEKVRVQGGAYGCFVQYSRATGAFSFISYRDPQVEKTLETYKKSPEFLGNLKLSPRELTCAIIGTIGDMDAYMLPDAIGATAMWRELAGDTEKLRQQMREEILATTLVDFHNFALPLEKALKNAACVSLGGTTTAEFGKKYQWQSKKILATS